MRIGLFSRVLSRFTCAAKCNGLSECSAFSWSEVACEVMAVSSLRMEAEAEAEADAEEEEEAGTDRDIFVKVESVTSGGACAIQLVLTLQLPLPRTISLPPPRPSSAALNDFLRLPDLSNVYATHHNFPETDNGFSVEGGEEGCAVACKERWESDLGMPCVFFVMVLEQCWLGHLVRGKLAYVVTKQTKDSVF